jgi:hypothetical protein
MIFLQMHKRAGELNQTLVKRAVRAVFVLQPDVFEDLVRLIKKLAIETIKKTDVMLVELVSLMLFHQRGDAFVFAAHDSKVKPRVQSPKSKVVLNVAVDVSPLYLGEMSRLTSAATIIGL